MCMFSLPSSDKSDSTKQVSAAIGNNIFKIPAHPGRPKEYNIDEPPPLRIQRVLKVNNTNEVLLAPAAVAPKSKSPKKTALQKSKKSAAMVEELAKIEGEVTTLHPRAGDIWCIAKHRKPSGGNIMTIVPPATRHYGEETVANVEGLEYILPLKVMAAEESALKRQAVYVPAMPPVCPECEWVKRQAAFEDISEEIDSMLMEKRRKGNKNSKGKTKKETKKEELSEGRCLR
ncbi:hypothetical protein EV426DRAFT_275553 [Tirmania nivea]|nr:hypothetical protein EV426DRAFT_275553 [Tirmania nivea]